jgi:hypothetical protein
MAQDLLQVTESVIWPSDSLRLSRHSGGADKIVVIWKNTGQGMLKYNHTASIQCVKYSPISLQLASCSEVATPPTCSTWAHHSVSVYLCLSLSLSVCVSLGWFRNVDSRTKASCERKSAIKDLVCGLELWWSDPRLRNVEWLDQYPKCELWWVASHREKGAYLVSSVHPRNWRIIKSNTEDQPRFWGRELFPNWQCWESRQRPVGGWLLG